MCCPPTPAYPQRQQHLEICCGQPPPPFIAVSFRSRLFGGFVCTVGAASGGALNSVVHSSGCFWRARLEEASLDELSIHVLCWLISHRSFGESPKRAV